MLKKDIGICIRTVDYSDTSQILTFFCKDSGKISVIAKGTKRNKSKFGGAIELLSYGELIFTEVDGAQLCSLREFDRMPKFMMLRNSLLTMNCTLFGAELINTFCHDFDPHQDLFDSFSEYLENLQTAETRELKWGHLIAFQMKILNEAGTGLILDRCTNCSNNTYLGPFFSSQANGFICRDCQMSFMDKIHLSEEAVDVLADLQKIITADLKVLYEIEQTMIFHIRQLTHKQPKLAEYFQKTD